MNNLKTKLISAVALVSLVGSPVLALAQVPTGVSDAKSALRKELQDLKTAREAFKDAKTTEAKERAEEARAKVESAKKTAETKRTEAEKRKEEQRKKVLLRLIEVQVKHFKNVTERVARMPNISDALKTQLKTEIDKAIASLNDLKAKVEAAKTAEELKALAEQVKDNLKTKREIVQKIVDAIVKEQLQNAITKAEERVENAETKIAELKTAGKDVTELEKLLATAKEKLAFAKTSLTKSALKEANEALKEVYKALREIAEESEE